MSNRIFFMAVFPWIALSLAVTCCNERGGGTVPDSEETETAADVRTYTTTADKSKLFKAKGLVFDKKLTVPSSIAVTNVTLDPSTTYQTVDGFGAAMTWASCYNLGRMTPAARSEFLKSLFGADGLGIGLIRVTIGASDFNVEEYTWCDKPGIENFAMHPSDRDVVLPVLKEIVAINPEIKVIASPWSCPRWMKRRSVTDESDWYSWTSGSLRPVYYPDYARYFVKWIQAMQAEGIGIDAVTVQNEPLNHGNSMSLYMTWAEQRDFIKTALGPAFEEAGLKTKILVFDHNYNYDNQADQKNYPLRIYADPEASKYVAGSAWHNYGGSVTELDNIVRNAPDKEIYFTEASIGTWNYSFDKCLLDDFDAIFLQTLARGCKGVTLWNMVLDEKRGPYSPADGSCKTCYGAVTLLSASGAIIDRTTHYYNIAHASKVIRPGAVRIDAKGETGGGLNYQAYKNPDGSFGVLVLNKSDSPKVLMFKSPGHFVETLVPAKAIHSLRWTD